jgi:hypothetical protein
MEPVVLLVVINGATINDEDVELIAETESRSSRVGAQVRQLLSSIRRCAAVASPYDTELAGRRPEGSLVSVRLVGRGSGCA